MVMKDKLVKTNHKASYYMMKKLSVILLAVVSAAFVIAVPTYIVSNANKNKLSLAEENTEEVQDTEDSGEDEVIYETIHY